MSYSASFRGAAPAAGGRCLPPDSLRTAAYFQQERIAYRYNARGQLTEKRVTRTDARGQGMGPHFAPVVHLTRWEFDYYR